MEKIWFSEYQKTGIPETVELPAENTSLNDVFERNFQKFASRDAFIFMDKVLTFGQLDEVVNLRHIYKAQDWLKAHVLQ